MFQLYNKKLFTLHFFVIPKLVVFILLIKTK